MFTKKSHADVKKSTAKLQDCKKDSASRLRHLRTILGNETPTLVINYLKHTMKLVNFIFMLDRWAFRPARCHINKPNV